MKHRSILGLWLESLGFQKKLYGPSLSVETIDWIFLGSKEFSLLPQEFREQADLLGLCEEPGQARGVHAEHEIRRYSQQVVGALGFLLRLDKAGALGGTQHSSNSLGGLLNDAE